MVFGAIYMVGIAQSVRAPDCGSGGRGFESLYPPHKIISSVLLESTMGYSVMVTH